VRDTIERLRRWAITYRGVGSDEKAELLDRAVASLLKNVTDNALAAELLAMALVCETDANQASAVTDMRAAAAVLAKS